MSHAATFFGFRLGLLAFWVLGLAAFKWSVIGPYRVDDFALGLAIEVSFWGWLAVVAEVIERGVGLPGAPRTSPWLARAAFYPLFYGSAGLVFSYTYFFDSAVERRFSLLDTDLGAMVFFFREVLPVRGWAILIGLLTVMHGGAYWVRQRLPRPSVTVLVAVLVPVTLTSGVIALVAERVATPIYDIAHDYRELWMTPKVTVTAKTRPFMPLSLLDKSDRAPNAIVSPYKKVLVFVMETMTAKRLSDETPDLRRDTFFVSARAQSHHHDRYFPNNQDSRTGMLDLLGSRLIPYEAYRDEDSEAYMGVARLPSLLDHFRRFGFKTAFAVSQTGLEVIVTDLPWDTLIHLNEADVERAKAEKLCFQPYEFENSCEDDVVLPKVLDFIDANERVFLFQEFIWGHAYEYNEASGRKNADYYSAYIDQVIAHLREKNLLDETLIAVTSDHGFRDKGLQDQLNVYRVPLIFHAPGFSETHNDALLSHLDFKDLLFNAMQPGSTPIDDNPAIMIEGPTATSLLAALTADNDFMLVKSRGTTRLLLSHINVGPGLHGSGAPQRSDAPSELLTLFDDYKRSFDARITAGR